MSNMSNNEPDLSTVLGEQTKISRSAADKSKGMTMDELGSAVQLAMRLGIPGDAKVKIQVGFKGQLQRIDLG